MSTLQPEDQYEELSDDAASWSPDAGEDEDDWDVDDNELGEDETEFPEIHATTVGRTTVWCDSHENPFKLVRDGHEVGCVCDPLTQIICALHEKSPDAPGRRV